MSKKILAAVVASIVAGQAAAITVVDDGTNKFTLNGRVGARFQYQKVEGENNTQQIDDGSRFGFMFESKLNEDVTAFARTEWGFNATDLGSDFSFVNRLGYAGVQGDFGAISAGKQYGAYYHVASWTDMFVVEGGSALGIYGIQGELNGTSRSENVAYNISANGLNLHASFQNGRSSSTYYAAAEEDPSGTRTRDYSYGIAASYDLPMGLSIGAAYNQAKFVESTEQDAKIYNVSVKYDQGPIYAAVGYSEFKHHNTMTTSLIVNGERENRSVVAEKARGFEAYVSYRVMENFKLETGYNELKDKANQFTDTRVKYFPVAGVYNMGPLQLAASYAFESSKRGGVEVKDRFQLQARYYF